MMLPEEILIRRMLTTLVKDELWLQGPVKRLLFRQIRELVAAMRDDDARVAMSFHRPMTQPASKATTVPQDIAEAIRGKK